LIAELNGYIELTVYQIKFVWQKAEAATSCRGR
jgi:hypothetical protein